MLKLKNTDWHPLLDKSILQLEVYKLVNELQSAQNFETIDEIWKDIWKNLHNQGDVSIQSYLSLPQIVNIYIHKKLYDENLLNFCNIIEQQRRLGINPELPAEHENYYYNGLNLLKSYAISQLKTPLNETLFTLTLALIANCNGNVMLGKSIFELKDEIILHQFLQQF